MTHLLRRTLITLPVLALCLLSACDRSSPTTPERDDFSSGLSVSAQADVEALIGGSLAGWWRAVHGFGPAPALEVAAGAHSSPWRNWGMFHAGLEPRQGLEGVDERVREFVEDRPWTELYRTLVASRDGLRAMEAAGSLADGGAESIREVAFARFTQGLALGTLAQLFDQAWILDETVDPGTLELSAYPEVMEAALEMLDSAIQVAGTEDFTIPAEWIGFERALDRSEFVRLARSWRARLRISAARMPSERDAVDWSAVLDDARNGIRTDWAGLHDGEYEGNWAWQVNKILSGLPMWVRVDYRTIGPADASGAWQEWMALAPSDRMPFLIDTDDTRITGGDPTADGSYMGYEPELHFPANRGTHRFSYYTHHRWAHLWDRGGVGRYIDFSVRELEFIEAEALYRLGRVDEVRTIVNRSRSRGDLPPFETAESLAPGGDRCVPKRVDGSCGDLLDALRYEKRIELFHVGAFTGYLDARGWGELLPGTFEALLQPDMTSGELLAEIYGVTSEADARSLAIENSAEGLRRIREAIGNYDRTRNVNPGDVVAR